MGGRWQYFWYGMVAGSALSGLFRLAQEGSWQVVFPLGILLCLIAILVLLEKKYRV